MAAFWPVFTFGGSGPAITAHGSLDLKQEIQIQIQIMRPGLLGSPAPMVKQVLETEFFSVLCQTRWSKFLPHECMYKTFFKLKKCTKFLVDGGDEN
jgi:hypothetical protein